MDLVVILAYAAGIILLLLLGRLLLLPLKVLLRLVYNALIGGAAIFLINLAGGLFGFHIALNVFTALVAGLLGIPGIALLAALKAVFAI